RALGAGGFALEHLVAGGATDRAPGDRHRVAAAVGRDADRGADAGRGAVFDQLVLLRFVLGLDPGAAAGDVGDAELVEAVGAGVTLPGVGVLTHDERRARVGVDRLRHRVGRAQD